MKTTFIFTVVIFLTCSMSQTECLKSDNFIDKQLKTSDVTDVTCRGCMTFENVTLTAYYPNDENDDLEENVDSKGYTLNTLQDFLDDNADFVTVSMDEDLRIPYGTSICIPELNAHYRRRINLQVRDTASNVKGQGYGRVDICVRSEADSYDHAVNIKHATLVA